jgi:hypothetical protein
MNSTNVWSVLPDHIRNQYAEALSGTMPVLWMGIIPRGPDVSPVIIFDWKKRSGGMLHDNRIIGFQSEVHSVLRTLNVCGMFLLLIERGTL